MELHTELRLCQTIGGGRHLKFFAEYSIEIGHILEAAVHCNGEHTVAAASQLSRRVFQPNLIEVFTKGAAQLFFE